MTHPNDNELEALDETVTNSQPIPKFILFPILKTHVIGIYKLSEENTTVEGFTVNADQTITVHLKVSEQDFKGVIPVSQARAFLTQFMQSHFGINAVQVLKWRLKDKNNPYLVLDYVILSEDAD